MTTETVPRVAVIGTGYWGKNLVRNFHGLGALAAICDADADARDRMAADYPDVTYFSTVDAVLADPNIDAVAVATPAETHEAVVRQAIEAGRDVFVEKPLCLSVSEGEALIELAAERERILMVGHLLWYHSAVLKLKELVDSGELGRIQYIYSNRLNLGKIRREENILWSFAPHDISVILGLLNEMPERVHTQAGNYLHPKIADVTVSTLAFPGGVKAHLFVSWLHPFKEQKLVVIGDRKMAVFDDVEPDDKLLLYPHSIEWRNQLPVASKADAEVVPLEMKEPLREECEHFLNCVVSRETPRTDGREGLRVLTVLDRCQQALGIDDGADAQAPTPQEVDYQVHPSAFIDDDVDIGSGTAIWHVSHIMSGTRIGRNCRIGQNVVAGPRVSIGDGCKIQNNVSVYEGVTLEEDVVCGPSMVFTNVHNPRSHIPRMDELRPTRVRRGATLGANCTIVCGITIGRGAFIGAGAVVTKDVPDYALVAGVPARQVGWICECGVKLEDWQDDDHTVCSCGRQYRRDGDRVLLNTAP
jgi:UDP-2-acetamido-3-amino-2,3-dideoxy-glucuronate N-acetyltransferase